MSLPPSALGAWAVAPSVASGGCSPDGVPLSEELGASEFVPDELMVTASELVMFEGSSGVMASRVGAVLVSPIVVLTTCVVFWPLEVSPIAAAVLLVV